MSIDLLSKLPSQHVEPLWTVMHSMVTPMPAPRADPTVWRYSDLRPLLLEAGRTVPQERAERRVLMLVNPKLTAPFTTDTLYAGLQLINPGETAPAHRHQAFALRFIIEGTGAFTAVDGEKVFMEPGDMILTPKWKWHDHGHEGREPMIWLDGLDLPLYHKMPIHFAEPYSEPRYPSKPVENSPLRFPWAKMKGDLDTVPGDSSTVSYKSPSGGHISYTLGAFATRVSAGKTNRPSRETCSYIFHVVAGKGKTVIEGATETTLTWARGDTFAVPAWSHVHHEAAAGEDAYLFALTDQPLLEGLDMHVVDHK